MIKRMKNLKTIRLVTTILFKFASCLPVKKQRIVFESFSGKQYSCNPRAIYEYLVKTKADYEMIWSINPNQTRFFEMLGIPYVRRFSLRWFFCLARAKFWVTNSRMPNWVSKPAHTIYIQTWHGTPLKKLVADMPNVKMPGITKEEYVKNFHAESSQWDYLISPNSYSSKIFKRAFGFDKQLLETGYPRNDVLKKWNNEEKIRELKEKFQLPLNKKILLYAPTWRDHHHNGPGSYVFDLKLDLQEMKEKLGDEYFLLLRLHSFISESLDTNAYNTFVKDVSSHYDINELYLVSDMLITDYSSVFFDYGNLKRPILFFVYDIEEYRDEVRGFYFSLEEEAPGPLVKTTDSLIKAVQLMDREGINPFKKTYDQFYNRFCLLEDGEASKRVVEEILLNSARRKK